MNDLMQGILSRWDIINSDRIRLQVYDNDHVSQQSLLYDSQSTDSLLSSKGKIRNVSYKIDFNGKRWTLIFSQLPAKSLFLHGKVVIVFLSGTIISVLIFVLSLSLFNTVTHKTLIRNESLQRILLENIAVGIIIIDPKTRIIESVNSFAADLVNRPKEDIIGKTCHQYMCPAQVNCCPVCDLGQVIDNSERILIRNDNSPLPVLKTVKKIQLGGKEKLLESFVDITVQKEAEETLKQTRLNYETFFNTIDDFLFCARYGGQYF
ncbi:MAG: PAS domain-containing protein, partial [Bacteroidales bacterium]|nr:PAS domain-containing protein [Bacteroidales bacterium]